MLKLIRTTDIHFPSDSKLTGALAKSNAHIAVGLVGKVLVFDIKTLELVSVALPNEYTGTSKSIAILNSLLTCSDIDGNGFGVVVVYDLELNSELKVLKDPQESKQSRYGEGLSTNGVYLAVTAPGSGLVYVYREVNKDLVLISTLQAKNSNISSGLTAVVLDDKIIISEPMLNSVNVISVYSISGDTIIHEMNTIDSDTNTIYGNVLCAASNETLVTSASVNGVYKQFDVLERTYSVYFDGRQDYIKLKEPIVLEKDFSIEAWVFYRDTFSNPCILGSMYDGNYTNVLQILNGKLFYRHSDINGLLSEDQVKQNDWVHLKIVRVDNTVTLLVNGFPQAQSYALVVTPVKIDYIGCMTPDRYMFKGFVSNLHIRDSVAWQDAIVYSAIKPEHSHVKKNTLLLTCDTKKIVDVSGNNVLEPSERVTSSEVSPISGLWRRQEMVSTDNPYKAISATEQCVATVTEDDFLEIYTLINNSWGKMYSVKLDETGIKNVLCTEDHVICASSDSLFVYEINKELI